MLGYDGANQVVGVVDTGIDTDHSEFFGRVLTGRQFIGGGRGHERARTTTGTARTCPASRPRATTRARTATGSVARPERSCCPIKVLNASGGGSSQDVALGIQWAADNGATVINLSLGGGSCGAMQSAIDYARSEGVVVVAAAGNSNSNKLSAARRQRGRHHRRRHDVVRPEGVVLELRHVRGHRRPRERDLVDLPVPGRRQPA